MRKSSIILIFLSLPLLLSGCAYNNGFNVKSENQKFALAIQRFEFLRHHGIPVIKPSVTPPMARDKTRAVKKTKLWHPMKPLTVKFKTKRIKKPFPAIAHIHGLTLGLPVLTVDFVNKPLWRVLQDISSKTGYMFTSSGIDLGKKVNLKGRYNLAKLLAVLFAKDKTFLNLKTKKITLRRGNGE